MKGGTRLGPYEILSPIGAGGMGEVYRARDTRLDRNVAIKVLPAHLAADADARARFEREARAVAALSHPNICALHDIGHDDGRDFLVMELLDGETLQHRLDRGALDLGQVLDFAIALADALDAAHARGIIHRDLKPANIFITSRGVPKILDFGLARSLGEVNYDITRKTDEALTAVGTIVGTVAYMSPEQLKGEPLDVRTDLFSLGLVLYEMATGQRAFSGPTAAVISAAILGQEPPAPRTVRADVPPRIEEAILKTLDKDRELRCQTAAELRADFTRAKRQSGPDSARSASVPALPAAAAPSASSRVPIIAVVAAALVAVVAIGAVLTVLLQNRAPAPAVTAPPDAGVARPAAPPVVSSAPAPAVKSVTPPRTQPEVATPLPSPPPAAQTSTPIAAPAPPPVADATPTPQQPETGDAGARGRRGRAAGLQAAGPLIAKLRMLPPETFTLVFAANDPASRALAFQIRGVLTSGGWTCESTTEIQAPQAAFGLFVPAPSDGLKAVAAWARRAGFEPDVRTIARLPHPRIVIGRQPQ